MNSMPELKVADKNRSVQFPRYEAERCVIEALREDIGAGDVTTEATIQPEVQAQASIIAKQAGVIAGLPVVELVFHSLDEKIIFKALAADGEKVSQDQPIASLSGSARSILTAERTALNFLGHLSGIATLTSTCAEALAETHTQIVDTRKTTPGLRALEKYAVRVGGGKSHRFGLSDGVLIKDNHIEASGGITQAVSSARKYIHHLLKIEVECETQAQVAEAVEAKADVIMLDNMSLEQMTESVRYIREHAPDTHIEASGNMKPSRELLLKVAATGVDFISLGSLTHSAPNFDVSLELLFQR